MILLIYTILILFIALELVLDSIILKLRKEYGAVFMTKEDEIPKIDEKGLNKFIKIGFDPELGWIRKPNTSKIEKSLEGDKSYHIDARGSRKNPSHQKQKMKIATFGDSYTFCREVNDNETWQHFLADNIKSNVSNFGVGNYGLDQAYLRYKRELPKLKSAKIIIIGIVPASINRNLSVWKHYAQSGNTLGFKPRFILENNELVLIPNPVNTKEKFFKLKEILPEKVNKYDYFYKKFKKGIYSFPYTWSILKSPREKSKKLAFYSARYFLEKLNINWKKSRFLPINEIKRNLIFNINSQIKKYNDPKITNITLAILKKFSDEIKKEDKIPLFLLMPQPKDVDYIKKSGNVYYRNFLNKAKKFIDCIDLSKVFIDLNETESIFPSDKHSDNYKDLGSHYNAFGNKIVANEITKFLKTRKEVIK